LSNFYLSICNRTRQIHVFTLSMPQCTLIRASRERAQFVKGVGEETTSLAGPFQIGTTKPLGPPYNPTLPRLHFSFSRTHPKQFFDQDLQPHLSKYFEYFITMAGKEYSTQCKASLDECEIATLSDGRVNCAIGQTCAHLE
jgi:hypothetical protein